MKMREDDWHMIDEAIDWYQSLPIGHSELERLVFYRRQISCVMVRLADYVGFLTKEYEASKGSRRIQFVKIRQEYREKDHSVASAESQAEDQTRELMAKEKDYEGRMKYGKTILDAVNQLLNSLAGEIRLLSDVYKTEGQRSGGQG